MVKKVFWATFFFWGTNSFFASAQTLQNDIRIGGGYFGQSITHPGFTINAEYVRNHTNQFSTPLRAEIGAYFHPRNHNALMFDISAGLREKFGKRFGLEQGIGLGLMTAFFNGDGLFRVSESGGIVRVSPNGNLVFMPSVSLGIWVSCGKKDDENQWGVYFRQKLFWQLPYNNLAMPHFALQAGISYQIKSFDKRK